MKRLKDIWPLILIALIILLSSPLLNIEAKTETFELTEEEEEYIENNPIVSIGVDPLFSPYEFIDSDGEYVGIAADYLKVIGDKTGLEFRIVEGLTWTEAYDMALAGDIDLLPCIGVTKQRKELFDFTDVYLKFQRVILSRVDDKIYSEKDLSDIAVGVQRNSSHFSYLVSEMDIEPELYENNDRLLLALSYGEINVAISNYASSRYRINELGITNIKIDQVFDIKSSELAIAVNKDKPVLRSIINKALNSITQKEQIEIQNKWFGIENRSGTEKLIAYMVIVIIVAGILMAIFFYWSYTLKKEIKHRMLIEEALKEAKVEADEANAAKSIFLARMSHEIRTPLNAISGLGYLLENTKTSNVQKKYIKNLKIASYNLLGIINDILDFSKIEAGEIEVENIEFSIDDLLEKVSSILMSKATEKGIEFHVVKTNSIPDKLVGDPTRIEQVLINLINNAIKFTEEGEVLLKLSLVEKHQEVVNVMFSVMDTGMGITEEQKKHLFIPFHQLDSSVTRTHGGTGLGLSISKNIVEMLGGKIKVLSEYGRGSEFMFTLPLSPAVSLNNVDKSKSLPDLSGIKALVYEEDKIAKELVVKYLEAFNVDVEEANSPSFIIDEITKDESKYRLLITNLNLKTTDTITLIKKVMNPSLNIVLLAKQVKEAEYELVEELGVKHIIMQPIIESILYNSVVQCFTDEALDNDDYIKKDNKSKVKHHILLVEDNEVNQMIEKEILEQRGYQITIANNGLEAVEFMADNIDVKLILMDIHMPVMDGYEATEKIRMSNVEVPILAMTAVSFTNIKDKCESIGMNGYVTKPVDPDELFKTIESYVKVNEEKLYEGEVYKIKKDIVEDCVTEKYLDLKQGMKRIGNNENLYKEVIEKFEMDLKGSKDEVSSLIKNQEFVQASKLVHKIKGCSGNIGAMKLYQTSNILMGALTSGVELDISPYLFEFESDFDKTFEIIRCMLNKWTENKDVVVDKVYRFTKDLEQRVIHLQGLLADKDIDAFRAFAEIQSLLPMNDPGWVEVDSLMKQYKFQEAYDAIGKFLGT